MPSPIDVTNVVWIMMPFVLAALIFTARACVRNLSQHRVILASACILAIVANVMVVLTLGEYPGIQTSVVYIVGLISYNISLWSSRVYVCNRMAKLSPSPAISTAFHHLTTMTVTLFVMTMVGYIMNTVDFYQTHSLEEVPESNLTAVSIVLTAELLFEITSLYLHAKCLKMFAVFNTTGIKLCVISCSTLTCIVFGMIQCAALILKDVFTELMMAVLQVAGLPSSIVLGEALAIYIGRRSSKSMQSSQGKSKTSQNSKTITNKSTITKNTSSLSVLKEDPLRQPAGLAPPSTI